MRLLRERPWTRGAAVLLFAAAAVPPFPTTRSQAAGPRVVVPVRVFDGKQFVPGLNLADFELLENGLPQTIEALYEIRRDRIEWTEPSTVAPVDVHRKFFLILQLGEYDPKLQRAVEHLLTEEIRPGDALEIQTPVRNYAMTPQALVSRPRDVLAKELKDIITRDIAQGTMGYNSVMRELKRIVRSIAGSDRGSLGDTEGDDAMSSLGMESQLAQYKANLAKMEDLRAIDETKLLGFARSLKSWPGQKIVIFVYQREYRPEINGNILDRLMLENQDRPNIQADLQEVFAFYRRELVLNETRIRQAFADSAANFNFLFMDKTPERISGVTMREQSEDVFKMFSQIAAATGGVIDASGNPEAAVRDALAAADAFYLLAYTPTSAASPGSFKTIAVRVKNRSLRVVARGGYFR
jgi:VWFA-related protein